MINLVINELFLQQLIEWGLSSINPSLYEKIKINKNL
jgi:hypothetical protein